MKKIILFLCAIALSSNVTFSQLTPASVEGISPGRNITFTYDGNTETRFTGLCYGKIYNPNSGPDVCFYSIDVTKAPSQCALPNFHYVNDSISVITPKVCYIVHNYYPAVNPSTGQLSNLNDETAAIQAAIWHYTNGLNVNTITRTAVKNRANAIITATDASGTSCSPTVTFQIISDSDPDYFLVRTTDDNGNGVSVSNIQLTISQGTLSTYTVNTTASSGGFSPSIEVIGTGTGIITAFSDNIVMPKGTIFRHDKNECPKVVLACPGPGALKITSDWGALPVELSSFNANVVNSDVTLNWSTASELNNSGFNIERKLTSDGEWNLVGNISGNGTTNNSQNYTFSDRNIASGRYNYRLKQIDFNGNFEYFNLSSEVEIGTPGKFNLSQNYPNPFNPSTKVNFDLAKEGFVSIKVFDNSGKEIATLVNEFKNAGYYTANFNAGNISSGIYYYRMQTEGFTKVMKMVLIK